MVVSNHANATAQTHIVLQQGPALAGATIFRADVADVRIDSYYGPIGNVLSKLELTKTGDEGLPIQSDGLSRQEFTAHNLTITVRTVHPSADLLLRDISVADLAFPVPHGASNCLIRSVVDEWDLFPSDPNRIPQANESVRKDRGLKADCAFDGLSSRPAEFNFLYGVAVSLRAADSTQDQDIDTGTFDYSYEGVQTGEKFTRILRIVTSGESGEINMTGPVRVTSYSPGFAAVGTLGVEDTEGRLDWGDRHDQGTVPAFEAEGTFQLTRDLGDVVSVEGNTTQAPTAQVAAQGRPASFQVPAIVGAVAAAAAVGVVFVLWGLYSRLHKDRLLDHPRRAQIMDLVRAEPGVETNTVAKAVGLGWALTLYHVGTLQRGGILVVHRLGGRTALFPSNAGFRGREAAVALLRRPSHRRVYDLLRAGSGSNHASLARELGITRPRVSQIVGDLRAAGLVESPGEGRAARAGRERSDPVMPRAVGENRWSTARE